jgi:hypothetical protein
MSQQQVREPSPAPAAQPFTAPAAAAAPILMESLTPDVVCSMQATAGNAAVTRWFEGPGRALARQKPGSAAAAGGAASAAGAHVQMGPFHVFVSPPTEVMGNLAVVTSHLGRMPPAHAQVLDPMFVVERLPGGRARGGGYFPPSQAGQWLGRESRTGVSDALLQELVITPGKGIIAITAAAMTADIAHYTVLHEAAHSVDQYLGIVPPGATLEDFRGIRYPRASVPEYAAEAYSRYIINPRRVGRTSELPPGETMQQCSERLGELLRRAPAFGQDSPRVVARQASVLARSPLSDQLTAARGRPKGEVFAILRARQGGADPDALAVLHQLYAERTDDRWLAETLLQFGPEPLWPAAQVEERARRSAQGRWGRGPGETPEAGNIRAELPFPAESGASSAQPVVAYFFPGVTPRRALVIGGVHGSEVQGARVVESLRTLLETRSRAGNPPHFTTILVPVLNARTHDPALQRQGQRYIPRNPTDRPSSSTEATGIEPNRTFPTPGEDYRDARARAAAGQPELVYPPPPGTRPPRATGHEATEMIPETRALILLIERFRPERIASVHAHSIGSSAAGRLGDDPGVFVDPAQERRPDGSLHERAGSRGLGERMLTEGQRRAAGLPPAVRDGRRNPFLGNVGGDVTYSPNAPHPRGYSLGDWAPVPTGTREGITTITVEVPQYGRENRPPSAAQTQQVEELHRDLLAEIFLGPDPPARP